MSAPPVGTCFGFEIRSKLTFEFLRNGTGEALDVELAQTGESPGDGALVFDWPASGELPHTRLFQDADHFRYWVDGGGWFVVDSRTPRITVPVQQEPVRREERLWSLPLVLCFAARGDVPLHAAAVEIDGSAVLIGAPRAHGKTTLAAGFLAAGHRVLSEDIGCLRLGPEPQVIPGPAMLRLRRDVAAGLTLDVAAPVSSDDARVHLAIASGARGTCDPVPLRAIVLLREADEPPRLERVSAAHALADLWELSFRLQGRQAFSSSFEGLVDVVRSVPVWNLFRPLRLDRLAETVNAVAAGV